MGRWVGRGARRRRQPRHRNRSSSSSSRAVHPRPLTHAELGVSVEDLGARPEVHAAQGGARLAAVHGVRRAHTLRSRSRTQGTAGGTPSALRGHPSCTSSAAAAAAQRAVERSRSSSQPAATQTHIDVGFRLVRGRQVWRRPRAAALRHRAALGHAERLPGLAAAHAAHGVRPADVGRQGGAPAVGRRAVGLAALHGGGTREGGPEGRVRLLLPLLLPLHPSSRLRSSSNPPQKARAPCTAPTWSSRP